MPWEKSFYKGAPGKTTETFYTVPPGYRASVQSIDITNRESASAIYVTLYIVPDGGTPGNSNSLLNRLEIPFDSAASFRLYSWRGLHPVDDEGGTIEGFIDDGAAGTVSSTLIISGVLRPNNPDKVVK